MTCKKCSRRVKDTLKSRWDHVWKYHPGVPLQAVLDMINPARAEQVGRQLGQYAKTFLQK
jgi:hypothetical protein